METVLGIIGAVLGIVSVVLKYFLTKEKTKSERIAMQAEHIAQATNKLRANIAKGALDEVQKDLDAVDLRIRIMRQARDAKRESSS